MTILILDDNEKTLHELETNIKKYYPNDTILCYNTYEELISQIHKYRNCIIYLDIMLQENNGIKYSQEIAKLIPNAAIILYSGYSRELYDVYEGNHVYFFEKPFTEEKLKKSLQIASSHINNNFFEYRFAKMIRKIPYSSIVYFESDRRIVKIYTDREIEFFYSKLDDLDLPTHFIRISKSFIVNSEFISKIVNDKIFLKKTDNKQLTTVLHFSKQYKKVG